MYAGLIPRTSIRCRRCWSHLSGGMCINGFKVSQQSKTPFSPVTCGHRYISTNHSSASQATASVFRKIDHRKLQNTNDKLQTLDCDVNKFTSRSHSCGQVDDSLVGEEVNLCGWVEFQRLGKFIVLRDCYGNVQLFVKDKQLEEMVKKLSLESVIQVKGIVQLRPEKDVNPEMVNGNIEVSVQDITVLNQSLANMPILARDYINVTEKTRLEYRYLDLRHPKMVRNLRLRSSFIMNLRNCLVDQYGFVEVETPTLFKATPGVSFTSKCFFKPLNIIFVIF